eukprot:CFRG1043T1
MKIVEKETYSANPRLKTGRKGKKMVDESSGKVAQLCGNQAGVLDFASEDMTAKQKWISAPDKRADKKKPKVDNRIQKLKNTGFPPFIGQSNGLKTTTIVFPSTDIHKDNSTLQKIKTLRETNNRAKAELEKKMEHHRNANTHQSKITQFNNYDKVNSSRKTKKSQKPVVTSSNWPSCFPSQTSSDDYDNVIMTNEVSAYVPKPIYQRMRSKKTQANSPPSGISSFCKNKRQSREASSSTSSETSEKRNHSEGHAKRRVLPSLSVSVDSVSMGNDDDDADITYILNNKKRRSLWSEDSDLYPPSPRRKSTYILDNDECKSSSTHSSKCGTYGRPIGLGKAKKNHINLEEKHRESEVDSDDDFQETFQSLASQSTISDIHGKDDDLDEDDNSGVDDDDEHWQTIMKRLIVHRPALKDIKNGKVTSKRHNMFVGPIRGKNQLKFLTAQAHLKTKYYIRVNKTLTEWFAPKKLRSSDNYLSLLSYTMDVLLPEMVIRLVQDERRCSYDEAEVHIGIAVLSLNSASTSTTLVCQETTTVELQWLIVIHVGNAWTRLTPQQEKAQVI